MCICWFVTLYKYEGCLCSNVWGCVTPQFITSVLNLKLDKQCQTCPVFLHIFTREVQAFIHVINSIHNGRNWSSPLATTWTRWLFYHHVCGIKNGPLLCPKTPPVGIFPNTAAYDLTIQYWTLTMPLAFCTSAAHWKLKHFWHDNRMKTEGCQYVPTLSTCFFLEIKYDISLWQVSLLI